MRSFSFVLLLSCITGTMAGQTPAPPPLPGELALFGDLPIVEAASLHVQNLQEAPANVTIISAADIRKFGYRTLAEALGNVRGFDMGYDRIYHYAGVHGFSLPGVFNSRFLVMLNGHSLTDNVFDSNNFFGQDFGLDMDLVQRIEVIRGPSSALYGSNGMFATINVVTKSPVDQPTLRVSAETDTFGEKKGLVSSSMYLGHGANLLVSASVFNNRGQDFYFPEFDTPQTHNGIANGMDGERGYHTFANLIWRGWDFMAYFNSHEKQVPLSWDKTGVFGTPGDFMNDNRDVIRLLHSSEFGATGRLRWQVSYDRYHNENHFDSQTPIGIMDIGNNINGDALSSQLEYSFTVPKIGLLTLGAQGQWNKRKLEGNYGISQDLIDQLDVNHAQFGLFAQQEVNFGPRWKAYLGLRFDRYDGVLANDSLSPRLALVYQHSSKSVYKFVYGHPFRNPSPFEQYYNGLFNLISHIAVTPLRPETANTFEISAERKLTSGLSAIVNLYDYQTLDLIQAVYVFAGFSQYRNTDDVKSTGIEFELSGKTRAGLDLTASIALQKTRNDTSGQRLVNSPRQVGKLRIALPVLRDKLTLSSSLQYLGSSGTLAGGTVSPVLLTDVTGTTNHLLGQFDVQFGVRNLFDRRYYDPVALVLDRMPGDGRSAFVKLIWRSQE